MKYLVIITVMLLTYPLNAQDSHDIRTDWKLAIHASTFRTNTLFETIDITRSLGIPWIEGEIGQTVSNSPDIKFDHSLSANWKDKIKAKLKSAGVGMATYGVTTIPNEEKKARTIFDFAKEMGIKTIVIQPGDGDFTAFGLIEKLCIEYNIQVAITNHSVSGSRNSQWAPEEVLKACAGRSSLIGASADIGHWMLSGIDPVGAIQKLKGRILNIHLSEISDGHDVVYTDRLLNVLSALMKQKYSGLLSIQFQYNWSNNVPDVKKCIQYFNQAIEKLATQKGILLTKDDFASVAESGAILTWLANKKIGNATGLTLGHVIIKPGESNPRHRHELIEEVLFLIEGELLKTIGNEVYKMSKGDVIRIPPGEFHNAKNTGSSDAVMIVVYSDAIRGFELEE